MEFNAIKRIKKETVIDKIVAQILELIREGHFEVGQKFPSERDLSSMLDVSRPSVREAMKVLQSAGLVDIRTGSGTYLLDRPHVIAEHFNIQNILSKFTWLEMTEARQVLETALVELAAQNADQSDITAMYEVCRKMQDSLNKNNSEEFLKHDYTYHMLIAEASGNRFLAEMLSTTRDLLFDANKEIIKIPNQLQRSTEYHLKIFDAIVNGDQKAARKEMAAHLENVIDSIGYIFD